MPRAGRVGRAITALTVGVTTVASVAAIQPSSPAAAAGSPLTFTIDLSTGQRPISPRIYGINADATSYGSTFTADVAATSPALIRLGGNRWTAYNWENNFSNAGSDYNYQNDDYLAPGDTTPTDGVKGTVDAAKARGAAALVTVPILDYVASDKNGPVTVGSTVDTTRFKLNKTTDPVALSSSPNLTDAYVYQDQFVYALKQAESNANVMFSLDNEPDLWPSTHPEVHPGANTYADLLSRDVAYANAIKRVAPTAVVTGPVLSGWYGFTTLGGSSDYGTQGDFLTWYLAHLKAASAGKTLVDQLDLHWYPEAQGPDGNRITGTDVTPGEQAAREQAPRSLWDPSYVEKSWITDPNAANSGAIQLIPRTNAKIAANNPGMGLAFSEWNYGAGGDISGGIASADVLGIFGKYGVNTAALWPLNANETFSHGAFQIFRNYDGHGATFGDTEVQATNSDPVNTSVYASTNHADPTHVVIVAINKNTTATTTSIQLKNAPASAQASVYRLTSASATPVAAPALAASGPGIFTYTMPAQSVSVIVPAATTAPAWYADSPQSSAYAGRPYSYTFGAAGSPAPTYAIASGSVPAGLALNPSTGVLSGTPTTTGSSTFTVQAANGHSPPATSPSLTITVSNPSPPQFTADSPPPTAVALYPYSYRLSASGAPSPTFSVVAGALPTGVALNATTGLLSGTPTATGKFTFQVQAANGVNPAATSPTLSVTVGAPTPGTLLSWGDGADGRLGNGSTASSRTPRPVTFPAGTTITKVVGGTNHGLALTSTGKVYAWGKNDAGQLGVAGGSRSSPVLVTFPSGTPAVTQVSAGDADSLAVTADGNVWGWGANWAGQLGTGNTTGGPTPVRANLGAYAGKVRSVAAASYWTLAVTTTGNLLSWGGNGNGQLGDGTTTTRALPGLVSLGGQAGHVVSAAGNGYGDGNGGTSLAVTDTGSVVAWGYNNDGEVGDGTTTRRLTPVAVHVPSGSTIRAVAAGWYHNLALTTSGAVLAWGYNGDGELGNGTTNASTVPVAVHAPAGSSALPVMTAVAANNGDSLILSTSGAAYGFGVNGSGQLGTGTVTNTLLPTAVVVPAGTPIVAAGAGIDFSFGVVGVVVTTASLPAGKVGQTYSATLAAAGGRPPYTWSVASGSLPVGLTLSPAGVVSGHPAAVGTTSFVVKVTDASSPAATATRSLTITVS